MYEILSKFGYNHDWVYILKSELSKYLKPHEVYMFINDTININGQCNFIFKALMQDMPLFNRNLSMLMSNNSTKDQFNNVMSVKLSVLLHFALDNSITMLKNVIDILAQFFHNTRPKCLLIIFAYDRVNASTLLRILKYAWIRKFVHMKTELQTLRNFINVAKQQLQEENVNSLLIPTPINYEIGGSTAIMNSIVLKKEIQFNTFKEIDESGLQPYVNVMTKDIVFSDVDNKHIQNLKFKSKAVEDFGETCFEQLVRKRNIICILLSLRASYGIVKYQDSDKDPIIKIAKPNFNKIMMSYKMDKASPYCTKFLEIFRRLNEAGIGHMWVQSSTCKMGKLPVELTGRLPLENKLIPRCCKKKFVTLFYEEKENKIAYLDFVVVLEAYEEDF
ncbi:hypothetical protein TSAR_004054 [Trichomalopsis sarcophagae]|uniref:Uncharacterized protein n=1 Tax=Trichomalopsis sarcophagae TaxID=543379 RepID=A0A232FM50_9HYME|nr:hypothetical protein TSAR_004054 [Trichomalopsis sarcophagae]